MPWSVSLIFEPKNAVDLMLLRFFFFCRRLLSVCLFLLQHCRLPYCRCNLANGTGKVAVHYAGCGEGVLKRRISMRSSSDTRKKSNTTSRSRGGRIIT